MERFFIRTASIVVCAAWAAGCGGPSALDFFSPNPSATPVAAPTETASNTEATPSDAPVTLEGEIAAAHALRMQGNYAEAGKDLGQILLLAPDHPVVVAEYGKTLLQQGRPSDALPFLRRALELEANNWSVYSAMGVAYDQVGDHAHAKLAYERALSLKPGAAEVVNNFAMSRMLAGDLDGARRLIAQVSTSADPKIAANVALLEGMKKSDRKGMSEPTPVAETPVPPPATKKPVSVPAGSVAQMTAPQAATAAVAKVPATTAPATDAPRTLARTQTRNPVMLAGVEMEKVPVDVLAGPIAAGPVVHKKPLRHPIMHVVKHVTKLAVAVVRPAPVVPLIRTVMESPVPVQAAAQQVTPPVRATKLAAMRAVPVKIAAAQTPMLRLASDE